MRGIPVTHATPPVSDDLSGTADERVSQLRQFDGRDLPADWLRRQLHAALLAWADEETELDIQRESKVDY
jgi:hypothetical protein